MAQRKVTTIPATLNQFNQTPNNETVKRKVAAYARVSTDSEEQQTSYDAQVDHYENYIKSREDWEFVKVYTDSGISGTSTKHREGFNQMIQDALDGRISLIVTKSVSRFARNTVDSLTNIRQLKEHGVECYFEKENIWTFDGKGELLLTIMSSLAQEESRSISENVKWGHRKRFADGKVTVPFGQFLGYKRGDDGNLVVDEEEAQVIRKIYRLYVEGLTAHSIAKQLTADGIPTPGGKEKWSSRTVQSILTNEKYKGDALLQKSFTVDFLTKKTKVNEGEIPQYYVEGNHEGIISTEVFETVQQEMTRRLQTKGRYSGVDKFSSKLICGQCGGFYGSKVWHSNSKYRKIIYQCNNKFKNEGKCATPHLTEKAIEEMFITAVNQLLSNKDEIVGNVRAMQKLLFDNQPLELERDQYLERITILVDEIQNLVKENARVVQDQTEYQQKYSALVTEYDLAKVQHESLVQRISDNLARRESMEHFIKSLEEQKNLLTEFDSALWGSTVESVTITAEDDVTFRFKDGGEIKI